MGRNTESSTSPRAPLPESVGVRIRTLREAAGMSLRGLARAVGVSPSLISQIEHGKATPSVGTLYAIVSELDISMDEVFFDAPRGAAAKANGGGPSEKFDAGGPGWKAPSEGPVLRAANRLKLTLDTGVHWELLTASHDPRIDFLYVTYPVGGESCPPDALIQHNGSEYGVVLAGGLGATVGEDSYELGPGDSIAFDSSTPHRIWTLGELPATAIWAVVGREDDPRVN